MTAPDPRAAALADDLLARLSVFARLVESEWYNGNVSSSAYERLNADLTGLVAVYIRPTIARLRKIEEAARDYIRWTQGQEGSGESRWDALRAALGEAPPTRDYLADASLAALDRALGDEA
jgi:hypothetical protein